MSSFAATAARNAVRLVSLISVLGTSNRALRSWVHVHRNKLIHNAFVSRDAVKLRRKYVSLGYERGLPYDSASRAPLRLWISGPGGLGKSTLAFHLAARAARESYFIPSLVDFGWREPLHEYVASSLGVVNSMERVPAAIAKKFLSQGEIGLIVDGLSEIGYPDASDQLFRALRSGAVQHAIVTSRMACPDHNAFHEVILGGMDESQLDKYVSAYLKDPTRHDETMRALKTFARGSRLSPLLARMAVDQIGAGRAPTGDNLELAQDYLCTLRSNTHGAPSEPDFLRACRVLADACVEGPSTPHDISEDYARGVLDSDAKRRAYVSEAGEPLNSYSLLSELRRSGVLQQGTVNAVHRIDFVHHPLAELLAAAHRAATSS